MRKILSMITLLPRFLLTTIKNFWLDDCYTKASTLTFYTLQSIVPFLALLFGIAQGFGFQDYLETLITKSFKEQKEVVGYAIQLARSTLVHIGGGVIAGVGVLLLFWTNITLLGYIEVVFNYIWKIKTGRTLFRKVTDYLTTIVLCPLVFVVSSSVTIYLKAKIRHLQEYQSLETISTSLLFLFKFSPYVLSWLLFFLLYYLMPNARLKIWPRVVAAILAGSLYQLWQAVYITLQIQIFNYNVIYGTFAILPLFLIWLQVSWLIGLAGAEIAAQLERMSYSHELQSSSDKLEEVNQYQLALLVMHFCMESFYSNKGPCNAVQIALSGKISLDHVQKTLDLLTKGELLVSIETHEGDVCYLPLKDPNEFTIKKICAAVAQETDSLYRVESSPSLNKISQALHEFDQQITTVGGNIKLKNLFADNA